MRGSRLNKLKPKQVRWLIVMIVLLIVLVVLAFVITDKMQYQINPMKYQDLIQKYAHEYELDPYLVAAVIKVESNYRADAVSNRGAMGLMQVMPDTGAWIAPKIGMDGFENEMLLEPEVNIRLGCWYLKYLYDRFDGKMDAILCGYNAGHNATERWLQNPDYSSDGKTFDKIPASDAQKYVDKVNAAYETYQRLYKLS